MAYGRENGESTAPVVELELTYPSEPAREPGDVSSAGVVGWVLLVGVVFTALSRWGGGD